MLNRAITQSQTPVPGDGLLAWREQLKASPASGLLGFIAVLMVVCVLADLYLWQASIVSSMQNEIVRLKEKRMSLEQENSALMLQVAQWYSPAYVEKEAIRLGLRSGAVPVRVPMATAVEPGTRSGTADGSAVWRRVTGLLPGLSRQSTLTTTAQAR